MSAKLQERLLYLISPIALLLVWELLIRAGFGDRRFIPAPSDIAVRFWQLTLNGELAMHTAATLWRVLAGFVIGAVPAVAIGLLMAMFRPVRIFFDPLVAALMPIPKVALMPLLLLAFGFGDASKIALVATAVFFPVVVNTYAGAANIERIYWDVAKNYGASTYVMFTRVVFFGALPLIFAGLRIALAVSFVVLVAAEFVASKTGIGYLIWNSWELLEVDYMFVGIIVIGILGLITAVLFQEIERKLIPWKAEYDSPRVRHVIARLDRAIPVTPALSVWLRHRPQLESCGGRDQARSSRAMTMLREPNDELRYSAIAIAVGCQSMRTWLGCPAMRLSQARIAGKPVRSKSHSLAMWV